MNRRELRQSTRWREENQNKAKNKKQEHASKQTVFLAYKISDPTATEEYQKTLRKNRKDIHK